jgi:DNA (cytosine-5)-methyltransferase 1
MPTVTANSFIKRPGGAAPLGVVGAFLKPRYGEADGQEMRARSLDLPAPTVVPTGNGGDLVAAHLIEYHSETTPDGARAKGLDSPLPTEDTSNRFGLTAAFLAKHYGDTGQRPGSDLFEPVSTVTACDHNALVSAHIKRDFGTGTGAPVTSPLPTIVGESGHASLVASSLIQMQGQSTGQPVDQPMNALTSKEKFAEVRAFMVAYYGNEKDGGDLFHPMRTVTSKDRLGLVTVEGVEYAIADIGMRMLAPRELYNAQGFRPDYEIDIEFKGKPLTKTAQVRMCGNSVCPPMARALVLANVGLNRQEAAA